MLIFRALLIVLALLPRAAFAQTCPAVGSTPAFTAGGSVFGRIAAQWNSYFAAKVDVNNGVLCNPTIIPPPPGTGTVTSVTYTGDGVVHSATPTAPVTTTGTLTAVLNTVTDNLFLGGPVSGGPSAPTYRSIAGVLACADLTNDGTACTANTGTSGTTVPFLDGDNTWSGTQVFGPAKGTARLVTGSNATTVLATDCGKTIEFLDAGANTLTTLASIVSGTQSCAIVVKQGAAAGAVTISDGAGATHVLEPGATVVTAGANALLGLYVSANSPSEYTIGGNTVPSSTPGSVTSVGLSVPASSIFGATGTPVTSSGTLGVTTTGTSGGVPYFFDGNTLKTSAELTANLPMIGGGAGVAPSVGTRSGNTTAYVTTTGTQTSGDCVKIDASGNHIANGSGCNAVSAMAIGTGAALTGPKQYYVCTGTCTPTPPPPQAGFEFCIFNDNNVATAITLQALGSSAMYENQARTAYGTAGTGTLSSTAAAGNKVCIVGRDSTHYFTLSTTGTWTAS